MAIVAPFLPHDRLRQAADDFLGRHHVGGYLPVPIEQIIEFDFSLDIVPMPGLKDEFDVDAFITADLQEIRVDRFIQEHRPNRYRFSLAHELGHLLVHGDIFKQLQFNTVKEWKTAMCSIPPDEYKWIEWQAYTLAGLILVPRQPLVDVFNDQIAAGRKAGVEIKDMDATLRRHVESSIGKHFEVSADVIAKRMAKEGLWGAT